MKRYWGVSLLCALSAVVNGSERDGQQSPKKVRKAFSDSAIPMTVIKQQEQNKLTKSAPLSISQSRRRDPDLVDLPEEVKSPSQVLSPGDYLNQGLLPLNYDQSCSPSPSDYYNYKR